MGNSNGWKLKLENSRGITLGRLGSSASFDEHIMQQLKSTTATLAVDTFLFGGDQRTWEAGT